MIDKSISYRLSVYISVAVIVVFIAFIVAYFLFNQRLLRENIENKAIGLISGVSSVVNREIISTKEISANISEQVTYYSRNGDGEKLLRQVVLKYPFLVSVEVYFDTAYNHPVHYFGISRKGNLLNYTQNEQHVFSSQTEMDYFNENSKTALPGWSAPYVWNETGEIVASYYNPISEVTENGSEIIGYMSAKLSLTDLNIALNQITIGERGYAFVVDTNGVYLTHPDKNRILKANLYSVSSEVLDRNKVNINKIFGEQLKGAAITYPSVLDYEKSWAYFSPIPETRWYLIFVMPYGELYKELYGVTLRMAIFAILGVILIYYLISYITRKQIEPLTNVTSRLTSFSSPFKLNTKNEVKQVANSLEYLKIWFEQYQIARQEEEMNNFYHSRDLQQASEIQQSLIKNTFPAFPERSDIDLHVVYKPAQVVSGDLFDYYFIDDNNLVFTIGDVSGKGIPAAIFMSVCQTIIKNNSELKQPRKIVEKTNHELSTSNNHQYFLTLFIGVLNVKSGVLTFCNAAHTFPFILKPDGNLKEIKSTHGLPLGLYPEKEYDDEQVKLEYGDTIILYTDGVYDALNEKNILTGSKWFQNKLEQMKDLSPKEITGILESELTKSETRLRDDLCLLALKYTP